MKELAALEGKTIKQVREEILVATFHETGGGDPFRWELGGRLSDHRDKREDKEEQTRLGLAEIGRAHV